MKRTPRRWLLGGSFLTRPPPKPGLDVAADRVESVARAGAPASLAAQPCSATHACADVESATSVGMSAAPGALRSAESAMAVHAIVTDCDARAGIAIEPATGMAIAREDASATSVGMRAAAGAQRSAESAMAVHAIATDCDARAGIAIEPAPGMAIAMDDAIPAPCEVHAGDASAVEPSLARRDLVTGGDVLASHAGIVVDPGTAARVVRAMDHGRTLRALRTARARRLAIALGLARATRPE